MPDILFSFNVDVLTIGAGVQGLTLFRSMADEGFSTALLDLGPAVGGQTTHSHAYVHWGHMWTKVDPVRLASQCAERWDSWYGANPGAGRKMKSYFVYSDADKKKGEDASVIWKEAISRSTAVVSSPEGLELHSDWKTCFEVNSCCLHVDDVADVLLQTSRCLTSQIDEITEINALENSVEVICRRGEVHARFYARRLVLTAGAGNETLARLAGLDSGRGLTQIVPTFMLVARGDPGDLPDFTGYLFKLGFIATRKQAGKNYWLISDRLDRFKDTSLPTAKAWALETRGWLFQAFPHLARNDAALEWGIFRARKIEGIFPNRKLPNKPTREQISADGRIWVLYPNFVTFALSSSEEWIKQGLMDVEKSGPRALCASPEWKEFRVPLESCHEQWKSTPYYDWTRLLEAAENLP